jgi:integrase
MGDQLTTEPSGTTLRAAVDRFLSCPRCANPNTRRGYAAALDKLTERLGAARPLTTITPNELADALEQLWGQTAAATWNQRRAATASFLTWCTKNAYPAPVLPAWLERRPEHPDETRAIPHAAIERLLTRPDIPLREKTLWRMLYETAARTGEILAVNVEDLGVEDDPRSRQR